MKILTAFTSLFLVALLTSPVSAGNRYNGGNNHYSGYNNHIGVKRHHGSSYYGGRHYSNDYRYKHHGYNYKNHGYNKHYGYSYKHHDNHYEYLVGGLFLGALLHHGYQSYHQPRVIHRTVIHSTPRVNHDSSVYEGEYTRRIIRDSEGRCFELTRRDDGSELLKELDVKECAE